MLITGSESYFPNKSQCQFTRFAGTPLLLNYFLYAPKNAEIRPLRYTPEGTARSREASLSFKGCS